LAISEIMRCRGWLKFGDQQLNLHKETPAEDDKKLDKAEEAPATQEA
jgi:hypothetical protein